MTHAAPLQRTIVQIAADHPAFAGHFPGSPVLPGVCLLAEVIEVALREPGHAQVIGKAPCIAVAKFVAPVRPGAELAIHLSARNGRLVFEAWLGRQLAASGHFEAAEGRPQR